MVSRLHVTITNPRRFTIARADADQMMVSAHVGDGSVTFVGPATDLLDVFTTAANELYELELGAHATIDP